MDRSKTRELFDRKVEEVYGKPLTEKQIRCYDKAYESLCKFFLPRDLVNGIENGRAELFIRPALDAIRRASSSPI